MDFVLFDDGRKNHLLPFTHTRPGGNLRCGILTIDQKWEYYLKGKSFFLTDEYLMPQFNSEKTQASLYINGRVFPEERLAAAVRALQEGEKITHNGTLVAFHTAAPVPDTGVVNDITHSFTGKEYTAVSSLENVWDIFTKNEEQIQADFAILTRGKTSQAVPEYVTALGKENIFIEEGAVLNPCIINAQNSVVYIGKDAEIMEGCMLRGNIALGEHAVLKMGAKVYSGTTIGPGCKVGGEIQNVVFYANSNKGHDGYLGNAVIGEWCNLGADTNCSNLKNDYGDVSIWSEADDKNIPTGLQFCGLMMGDHSKCSINTMFNTGTVVGVSCNIFGTEFPPKFIPSFSWGGSGSMTTYKFDKSIATANKMLSRRSKSLSEAEVNTLSFVFEATGRYRNDPTG